MFFYKDNMLFFFYVDDVIFLAPIETVQDLIDIGLDLEY